MSKIRHLAIKTKDPARLAKFYEEVFGLQVIHKEASGATYMSDGYLTLASTSAARCCVAASRSCRADNCGRSIAALMASAMRSELNVAASCAAARSITRAPSRCWLRSTGTGGVFRSQTMPIQDSALRR